MTKSETSEILKKIQAYRQSFLINENVLKEWSRILEEYDYEDVDNELNKYFKSSENFGRYPDAYYLTKYLKKHEAKLKRDVMYIKCPFCNEKVEYGYYDEHYGRCSSIDYVCRIGKKYFNKEYYFEKLSKMTSDQFEKAYWELKYKLYEIMDDNDPLKKTLRNSLLSHENKEIEIK